MLKYRVLALIGVSLVDMLSMSARLIQWL